MTFLVVAVAGAALLVLPGAAQRLGSRLAPREWAWLTAAALAAGGLLLEAALVLRAAPGVLAAAGLQSLAAACGRLLGPLLAGGPAATWATALAAAGIPVTGAAGIARSARLRRRLTADLWLGHPRTIAGHHVVVLPVDRPFAVSLPGPDAAVVLSQGLVDRLDPVEAAAVVRHEAAHLAGRHQQLLFVAEALGPTLGRLPGVRRSVAALRLAIERAADETAAATTPDGRSVLSRTLLRLLDTTAPPAPTLAFAEARTVAARLAALDDPPVRPAAPVHAALYLPGVAVAVAALPRLYQWADQARTVLAMAGRCAV